MTICARKITKNTAKSLELTESYYFASEEEAAKACFFLAAETAIAHSAELVFELLDQYCLGGKNFPKTAEKAAEVLLQTPEELHSEIINVITDSFKEDDVSFSFTVKSVAGTPDLERGKAYLAKFNSNKN